MKGYVTVTSQFVVVVIYTVLLYMFQYNPIILFLSAALLAWLQPMHYFNPADGKDTKGDDSNER